MIKWKTRIEKAKQRGHFTFEDQKLIANFATCAVGERIPSRIKKQCSARELQESLNTKAKRLGQKLCIVVNNSMPDFDYAMYLHDKIYELKWLCKLCGRSF